MKEQAPLEILYELVHVNSHRIQGYHKAIQETDEEHLRTLFVEFQRTSHSIHSLLYKEIELLGGNAEQLPNPPMYLSNILSAFRMVLAGTNRNTILNGCEYTEAQAERAYKSVMSFSIYGCAGSLQSSIREQYRLLAMDYAKVKSLREMLRVAK